MAEQIESSGLFELLLWLLRLRRRFRVSGASMLPILEPGDEVLIDPKAYRRRSPLPGDIVVARHPHQRDLCVIKRVESVLDGGSCRLRGDNPDESTDSRAFGDVSPSQILGCVTSKFG
jgi:nickel-type superoxide dismutase maturation protease